MVVMVRSIIVVVGIVVFLLTTTIALAVPTFGKIESTKGTAVVISTTQSPDIRSSHTTTMTMISNQTAAQIVNNTYLPGIGNDSVTHTAGFEYWEFNGTRMWGNEPIPQYIVYSANPATLAIDRTQMLAFIGDVSDHGYLMPRNDTSDKYVWAVVDISDHKYPRDYGYVYYVDSFSGRIVAYG